MRPLSIVFKLSIAACVLLGARGALANDEAKDKDKEQDVVTVTDDDDTDSDSDKSKDKDADKTKDTDKDDEKRVKTKDKTKTKTKDADTETESDRDSDDNKRRSKAKKTKDDSDSDSDSDKVRKTKKRKDTTDSDSDSDSDTRRSKTKKTKSKDTDSDTDSDRDEVRKTKKHKLTDTDSDSDSDSDKVRKTKKHKLTDTDSDSDSDSDKVRKTKKHKLTDTDPDADDSDQPAKAKRKNRNKLKATDSDTDTEVRGKHKSRRKDQKKTDDQVGDDEIEMDDDTATRVEAAPLPSTPDAPTPLAIDERRLTLAKDRLELHGGFPISVLTLPGATPGTTTSTTSEALALGVTYGIDDKAEVGGDYALSLSPGNVKGPITLHGAYRALHDGKLEIAVAAALAIDFYDTTDSITMATSTNTAFGLQLGAWVRYHVAPKVSLFTGLPALPDSSVSLSKLSFALPPLPYQLVVGLNNHGAIALELPAGVGFQATPNIYAFAALNLANIRIANTSNAFIFKDFIPIVIGGFYSFDKFDIGASFADDLKQGTDYLRFELLGRYALK